MDTIKEAMEKYIPKSEHKFIYQLRKSPEIQLLESSFKRLKQNAEIHGWTWDNYNEYQRIRQELRIKCKDAWNQNWEDNINSIISISKNSKAFWNKIKVCKGKNLIHTNYLKDSDGNKYYLDKEKCDLMERTWKDIFRITEEEEANFDAAHSEHINSYINIFHDRLKPYNTSNLNRLNNENFYTRKIEKYEII